MRKQRKKTLPTTLLWQRSPFAVLLLLFVLLLSSCGSSSEQEIKDKMSQARLKVQAIERQVKPEDKKGPEMLEQAESTLASVEKYLTEEDYFQALALLDDLLFRLDSYIELEAERVSTNKGVQVFGTSSSYRSFASDGFQPLENTVDVKTIKALKAGFRSFVKLKWQDGTSLDVLSESEISLSQGQGVIEITLIKGTVFLSKAEGSGLVTLTEGGLTATLNGFSLLEMGKDPVSHFSYLANYSGVCKWQMKSERDSLDASQAVSWSNGEVDRINLPTAPRIESPEKHSTLHLDGMDMVPVPFRWYTQSSNFSFQLQVSEEENFVTRVYDDSALTENHKDVPLAAGEYHWRVRGFKEDSNGAKIPGPFTQTMVVYVSASGLQSTKAEEAADDKGPKPTVSDVTFKTIGTSVIASGQTLPNMRVKINGVSAIVSDDGQFRAIFEAQPGAQTIRLVVTNPDTGATTIQEHEIKI